MKIRFYVLLSGLVLFMGKIFSSDFRSHVSYWQGCLSETEYSELKDKRENIEVSSYSFIYEENDLFELKLRVNDAIVEFIDLLYSSECSFVKVFSNYISSLVKKALIFKKQNENEGIKNILSHINKISKEIESLDYSRLQNSCLKELFFKLENLKVLMQVLVHSKPCESNKIKSQFLFRELGAQNDFDDKFLSEISVDSIVLWEIGKKLLEEKGLGKSFQEESSNKKFEEMPSLEVEWNKELEKCC